MKAIISGAVIVAAISTAVSIPALATVVKGNTGVIVRVVSNCEDGAIEASRNVGAIIKIDGGQCDVNKVLENVSIKSNTGAVITVDNVCGTPNVDVARNVGAVVKVNSTGACQPQSSTTTQPQPTTVVVTEDVTPVQTTTPVHTEDKTVLAGATVTTETPVATTPVVTSDTKASEMAQGDGVYAELPETGQGLLSIIFGAGLAIVAYVGTFAIRAIRRS